LLFALMAKASGNIADLYLWHEMALARESWQTGHVPAHDSFAYTPTLRLIVHHEWGAGVLAMAIWDHAGAWALMPWNFALAAAAFWLAMDTVRRRGAAVGATAFGAIAMAPLIAGVLVAMTALLFANPYGSAYITYLVGVVPKARPLIDEWHPAWTSEMFPLVAAACVVFAYTVWQRRGDWVAVALVALVGVQAVMNRKMIPFFTFAWLAYVPAWVQTMRLWCSASEALAEYQKLLQPAALVAVAGCAAYLISTQSWSCAFRIAVRGRATRRDRCGTCGRPAFTEIC
jgi:hypothetical protein